MAIDPLLVKREGTISKIDHRVQRAKMLFAFSSITAKCGRNVNFEAVHLL